MADETYRVVDKEGNPIPASAWDRLTDAQKEELRKIAKFLGIQPGGDIEFDTTAVPTGMREFVDKWVLNEKQIHAVLADVNNDTLIKTNLPAIRHDFEKSKLPSVPTDKMKAKTRILRYSKLDALMIDIRAWERAGSGDRETYAVNDIKRFLVTDKSPDEIETQSFVTSLRREIVMWRERKKYPGRIEPHLIKQQPLIDETGKEMIPEYLIEFEFVKPTIVEVPRFVRYVPSEEDKLAAKTQADWEKEQKDRAKKAKEAWEGTTAPAAGAIPTTGTIATGPVTTGPVQVHMPRSVINHPEDYAEATEPTETTGPEIEILSPPVIDTKTTQILTAAIGKVRAGERDIEKIVAEARDDAVRADVTDIEKLIAEVRTKVEEELGTTT